MAVRKDLLLELAAFLETLPLERFDYGSWVGSRWKDAEDLSCGTTACALGWGATIPSLREAGLRLGRDRFGDGTVYLDGGNPHAGGCAIDAAMHVFGLEEPDAEFVFMPGTDLGDEEAECDWMSPGLHAPPTEVAAHIRRFVEARS